MNEEADGFGIYMEEACDSLSGVWTAFRPLAIQNHMPQGSMSMPNLDAQILENDRLLPLSFSVQKAVAIPNMGDVLREIGIAIIDILAEACKEELDKRSGK